MGPLPHMQFSNGVADPSKWTLNEEKRVWQQKKFLSANGSKTIKICEDRPKGRNYFSFMTWKIVWIFPSSHSP